MDAPFLSSEFLIRWSRLQPARVEADITQALQRARDRIDAVASLAEADLTFDRVLLGLESATRELNLAWGFVCHLDSVCNSPDLRKVHNAMLPQVTDFYTQVSLDPRLWRVLKTYAATAEALALTGVRQRFLNETLADFRESGADLPDDRKKRLEALNAELALTTQKYAENVLDSTNAWEKVVTDPALLAGLPESARSSAAQSAQKKGVGSEAAPAWRFTLHQPSMVPVLQYAERDEFRREVWQASVNVGRTGSHDNGTLVWEILDLRQEKARLLGFPNFADLTTHRRMAASGAAALRFVEDMHDRVRDQFLREVAQLEQYRARHEGGPQRHLKPWELSYWSEKQRKALYDFDPELLRPYLPMTGVIKGMFGLAEKLFGIQVRERGTVFVDPATGARDVRGPAGAEPVEVWHPEVQYYEVFDGARHVGSFYCDWYPRESKRGGAWMNFFHTGGPRPDGTWRPHLGLMCGNMSPPIGGKPALLTHDEVTTVFHEFGHLLHHLLCEVEIESLSGTRVAWDFVELPSQLLENWCWERESLDLFARHYETGAAVPEDLLARLLRARQYRAASAMMQQLAFGKLDLDLHICLDQVRGMDLDEHWRSRLADYLTPVEEPGPAMTRRFTHLFGDSTGYAAGYYSYKWAEVLEADVFTAFLREGVLNGQTGRRFRDTLLSRGNSKPAVELFRAFMGRDPDLNALLVREGLLPAGNATTTTA